jgi:predicted Fe-Mo cluster-binding NifX family protein
MEKRMKIAFVTDDGKMISRHFGRAAYYTVVTVEDGKETARETRAKIGHQHFAGGEDHHHHHHGQGSGMDAASQDRHSRMLAAIEDCQVLVGGGMGTGAYRSMEAAGIKPYITDLDQINDALQAYLDGSLVDHREKLH